MKKKQLALTKKLLLNKSEISSLAAGKQQQLLGGDLVAGPKPDTGYKQCTIEVFRLSYEVQCPETMTGPCTGQFCITTGPTC